MSRFLNKKEEVIDLKLTSYGKYLLSRGTFKPVYYAFYDDNVVYDAQYFGRLEVQNETRKRIKEETQYLEGLVLFEGLEKKSANPEEDEINFALRNPVQNKPRKDMFRFDQALGDAHLQGGTRVAPAWKVAALDAAISASTFMDIKNNSRVPQIYITASYSLKTMDSEDYFEEYFDSDRPMTQELRTSEFVDDRVIFLDIQNPLIYVEEMNTELLMENYEIEVYEFVDSGSAESLDSLKRIFFKNEIPQVVDGFMISANKQEVIAPDVGTGSVGYYFDIERDAEIDRELACRSAGYFNKESYYIDLDFDCTMTEDDELFFDIYGQATEPEICLD